ncbi:MAG: COG4315 family predicted lipoprotein [Acidimicrobiales bacterium]
MGARAGVGRGQLGAASPEGSRQGRRMRRGVTGMSVVSALGVVLAACGGAPGASPSTSTKPIGSQTGGQTSGAATASASTGALRSAHSSRYGSILTDAKGRSLYLLTSEKGGQLRCSGSCLAIWPPLEGGTASPPAWLKGMLGTVSRAGGKSQVTVGGYPVYTYSGDQGPAQVNGEGIKADSGTWELISSAGRGIPPSVAGTGSSGGSGTTTSAGGSSGYGSGGY